MLVYKIQILQQTDMLTEEEKYLGMLKCYMVSLEIKTVVTYNF